MKTNTTKPRIWPADMDEQEVRERLKRMKGYNAAMVKQGTPQFCAGREYVEERLREVGMGVKLANLIFA